MIIKNKIFHKEILYIFFLFLSLNIFFFSTIKAEGKAFEIDNIEISKPFEINFNKNLVIDEGFRKAFLELMAIIVNSTDQKKINLIKLNEIKGMVETFSIKEEKFVNEIYFVNLGVSFNKKKVFDFLEKKNIFPSIPIRKKILFIPVIIDENKKELLLFSNNEIFNKWNEKIKNFYLLEYLLPTEDLEDMSIIKENYENIEQYEFKEIISKYGLKDSIIALFFKNEKEVRVLSRITISDNVFLKNQNFNLESFNYSSNSNNIINDLKIVYEDYWKNFNQINTSIRLTLNIKVENKDNFKISEFENVLGQTDLIYDFYISKLDNNYVFYQIIFNGTPNNFLKTMAYNDYKFNTQNKIWVLK